MHSPSKINHTWDGEDIEERRKLEKVSQPLN